MKRVLTLRAFYVAMLLVASSLQAFVAPPAPTPHEKDQADPDSGGLSAVQMGALGAGAGIAAGALAIGTGLATAASVVKYHRTKQAKTQRPLSSRLSQEVASVESPSVPLSRTSSQSRLSLSQPAPAEPRPTPYLEVELTGKTQEIKRPGNAKRKIMFQARLKREGRPVETKFLTPGQVARIAGGQTTQGKSPEILWTGKGEIAILTPPSPPPITLEKASSFNAAVTPKVREKASSSENCFAEKNIFLEEVEPQSNDF